MATSDELAALKRAINYTVDDATTYPDPLLSATIDAAGSVDGAAARIWREKAASFADFVNVTESGSSRSLSDLHRNAMELAAGFDKATRSSPRSHTTEIERV